MANLDSLISVTVTTGSPSVSVAGFGTLLIASDAATGFATNEVREYTTPDEISADADLGAQAKVDALAAFAQSPRPTKIKVADYDPAGAINDELTAIEEGDADWYGLCVVGAKGTGKADQALVSPWVEARRKQYWAQTSDTDVKDGTAGNFAATAQTASYDRTLVMYHDTDTEPAAIAWLGKFLATDPDSGTTIAAWKILAGIPAQTQLSADEITQILTYNANLYSQVKGLGSTQEGKMASGQYADVILTRDWMEARIEEAVAQVLSDYSNRGEKIPYSDAGIATLENTLRTVLKQGARAGHILAETIQINAPLLSEVSAADKTARILRLSFSATLAGAIQSVSWTGQLAVST